MRASLPDNKQPDAKKDHNLRKSKYLIYYYLNRDFIKVQKNWRPQMGNASFQFKQFIVRHDLCAMKVGTDGVLLGAWAPFAVPKTILDVGTGSGLLALMVAQRYPTSAVTAIDIDGSAVAQATINVEASPFSNRISIEAASLQQFTLSASPSSFDAIICNPPFFENSLLAPELSRRTARHATELTLDDLVSCAARLLRPEGQFAVVMPSDALDHLRRLCFTVGLNLETLCHVKTTPTKAPKRTLSCWRKGHVEKSTESTLLLTLDGRRSPDYSALTADFYL